MTSRESCSISDYADRSKLVAPWGVSRGSPTPPACRRIARDEAGLFRLQQRSVPAGYYTLGALNTNRGNMAGHSESPGVSLAGRWHLVAAECPEDQIPQHRVDLVFHEDPTGLRGAILSRADGSEIPLQSLSFSGVELRLRMSGPLGQPAADVPFLVMAAVGGRFEGGWEPGTERVRLKLIQAREMT